MTRLEKALVSLQSAVEHEKQVMEWLRKFHANLPKSVPKKTAKQLEDFIRYMEYNT